MRRLSFTWYCTVKCL